MDRNAPLVASSAISQQDFDKLVANFEVAEGQVLTAQANVLTAKINLSYCTMSSPFIGLLGASNFFEGAVVGNPNTTNLNSLVQIDPLWAQFSPSATEWPKYAALMAKGALQASVTFDGAESISAIGKIVFADNQVSTSTSTLMLRVEFDNPNLIFRPGVYADVEVDLGAQPNVLVVPEQSVFAREADLYVWRVKVDNTVESVQITVLKKVGDMVALISGPQVGDRIVVEGIQRLKTGTKIIDTTNATPAPAPVAPATTTAPAPAPAPQTK
jgi:membrane fusion protein (multidrug efflux system)